VYGLAAALNRLAARRTALPPIGFGGGLQNVDRTRILQMLDAEGERVLAGGSGHFIHKGFHRERRLKLRGGTQPRGQQANPPLTVACDVGIVELIGIGNRGRSATNRPDRIGRPDEFRGNQLRVARRGVSWQSY
jgi:hypothetical protein